MQTQTVREVVRETHILPSEQPNMKNKGVSTKPFMLTKGVSCRSLFSLPSLDADQGYSPQAAPLPQGDTDGRADTARAHPHPCPHPRAHSLQDVQRPLPR